MDKLRIDIGMSGESPVILTEEDLKEHVAIFGRTGRGKSTLLVNCTRQLIEQGAGVTIIDPDNDTAEDMFSCLVEHQKQLSPVRRRNIVYIKPGSKSCPCLDLFKRPEGLTEAEDDVWLATRIDLISDVMSRSAEMKDMKDTRRMARVVTLPLYMCGTLIGKSNRYFGMSFLQFFLQFSGEGKLQELYEAVRPRLPMNIAMEIDRLRYKPTTPRDSEIESTRNLLFHVFRGAFMEQMVGRGDCINPRQYVRNRSIVIWNLGTNDDLSQQQRDILAAFAFILESDACYKERVPRHVMVDEAKRVLGHDIGDHLNGARRRNMCLWLIEHGIADFKNDRVDVSEQIGGQPGVKIAFQLSGKTDLDYFAEDFAISLLDFEHVWKPMDRPTDDFKVIPLPETTTGRSEGRARKSAKTRTQQRATKRDYSSERSSGRDVSRGSEVGHTSQRTKREQTQTTNQKAFQKGVQLVGEDRRATEGYTDTTHSADTSGLDQSKGTKRSKSLRETVREGNAERIVEGLVASLGLTLSEAFEISEQISESVTIRNHLQRIYREEWYPSGLLYDVSTQISMVKQILQGLARGEFLMRAGNRRTVHVRGHHINKPFEKRSAWGKYQVEKFLEDIHKNHDCFFVPKEVRKCGSQSKKGGAVNASKKRKGTNDS